MEIKDKHIYTFILLSVFFLQAYAARSQDILDYVRPEIGTVECRWFFFTPAAVPQGMAKLAPSTNGHYGNANGWQPVGYDYRHNSIEGFVNFHEWQIGGVSFMPTTGPLKVKPGDLEHPESGYLSKFRHKTEVAEPGYYKVLLDSYDITVELTATKHVGFQRYVFPENTQSHILLDIGNVQGESGEVINSEITMVDEMHFEGFVSTYPKYLKVYDPSGQINMYFYGEISKAPKDVGTFTSRGVSPHTTTARGKGAGLFLNYTTTKNEAIVIKVGLSYTSVANARLNLKTEATHFSFDEAKKKAQRTWKQQLGKIRVMGGSDVNKTKFYTGLYHALLGRGIANDVNGAYPKHGGSIGQLPLNKQNKSTFHFINTDAIWGAFWDLTQLWALVYPNNYKDFIKTQLQLYKDRGWFGDGIANSNYVSGVGTNYVGLVVAAGYQVGIRGFNKSLAYSAVRKNILGDKNRKVGAGKMDLKAFLKYGYVPYIKENKTDSAGSNFSASHTLEYCFGAFAAAQMAKDLGKDKDYRKLMDYSRGWQCLYNPENKLLQPKKADGAFIEKFDPYQPWKGYQEGNAIQYSFYVPQNPEALISSMGTDYFNNRLNGIFEKSQKENFGGGKKIGSFSGVTSLYNQGNQPCLYISWLFNFSGKPWLTQKWTRAVCNKFYGTTPLHGYGYGQDEDQGQLGSWYVLAALGLFDVKGFTDARPIVELGSPIFGKAIIKLGNGKELKIITKNNSEDNYYVQSVEFNGQNLKNCWLYLDRLMKGGTLKFVMGNQPDKTWGTQVPPPSAR